MIHELGRILAALVLLIARAIGRAFHGLRYLVRRARQTRTATSATAPKTGLLLDIAALSLAANVFFLAEMWRREFGPLLVPVAIGLGSGIVGAVAIAVFLRGPAVKYALAGSEALRLAGAVAYAVSAPAAVTGGTSDARLGAFAIGWFFAFGVIERALWGVVAPKRLRDATAYFVFLLIPILLLAVVTLFFGGVLTLILAQIALFAAMCISFAVDAPAPREPKPPKPSRPPRQSPQPQPIAEAPVQRAAPDPDSPDGSYHVYRPTSLNGQPPNNPENP
jgi:hypothetical protein